nr:SDR family oxidoreductase [Kribbella shirazensis]
MLGRAEDALACAPAAAPATRALLQLRHGSSVGRSVPIGVLSWRSGRSSDTLHTQSGVHKNRAVPDIHQVNGVIVGKLDGKVAVITGGSTGMALAGAKLFVEEGAYVFIQARRQEALDDAVKLIGRNVTAVQGDAAELDDLDRLYDTVKREKGSIDVLWASAGMGEPAVLGEITEEQFHRAFWLNARGTLFTVQKALPLINDNGSILMTGSNASLGAFPGWSLYAGSKAVQQAWARVWLNELRDRKIRVNVLTPGQVATAKQEELFDEATKAAFESLIPRGQMGRPEEVATVALFLASDDSSYVNGLELVADGGTTAI